MTSSFGTQAVWPTPHPDKHWWCGHLTCTLTHYLGVQCVLDGVKNVTNQPINNFFSSFFQQSTNGQDDSRSKMCCFKKVFLLFLTSFAWRGDTNSSAWVEKERQNIPSAILVVKCPPPMKGSLSLEKLAEGTLYKGRIDGPRPPTTHDENQSPKSGLKDSFRSFCEFSNICWNGTRKLRADGDCQSKKLTRMVESSTTS